MHDTATQTAFSPAYQEFVKAKVRLAERLGFDVDDGEINPILKAR